MFLRICIYIYPISLFLFMKYLKKEYSVWCENNYVVTEDMHINWLNYYLFGYFIILTSYVFLITAISGKSGAVHGSIFIVFSITFFSKVYCHRTPYLERYMQPQEMDEIKEPEEEKQELASFDSTIASYKEVLLEWFEIEKPYLRKDFRLLDLNEKIPLNRTYLSRLINEHLNTNFNNLITDYRLKESAEMLSLRPELNIKTIAEKCGFSSSSVFARAFMNKYGKTPSVFRSSILMASSYNSQQKRVQKPEKNKI